MFDKMIYREANIYIKGGLLIKGFIKNIDDDFIEVDEHNGFELTIISLDEITAIRGQPQNIPHDEYNIKESAQFYPAKDEVLYHPEDSQETYVQPENSVRVAAKVSKGLNDFSMPLPNSQEGSYVAPNFVRRTARSEK